MRDPKKNQIKEAVHSNFVVGELQLYYQPPPVAIKLSDFRANEQFFRSIWDISLIPIQEQVYVAFLNRANEVICWRCLHTGTGKDIPIDINLMLAIAFTCLAKSIVVAHNHPSGNTKPSRADVRLTLRLVEAFKQFEIEVLDHLIITEDKYLSMAEEGMM